MVTRFENCPCLQVASNTHEADRDTQAGAQQGNEQVMQPQPDYTNGDAERPVLCDSKVPSFPIANLLLRFAIQ